MDAQEVCMTTLTKWIIQCKRETYEKYVKNSNESNELQTYVDSLELLEIRLKKAINSENMEDLKALKWPEELMECIKDMSIRSELLDIIYESLVIHHFNRSPKHEEELRQENLGLQ